MPDADPPSSSDPSATRNLPALIPQARQGAPESADNWFTRALRTIFRWKSSTIRADLKDVLEGAGDTGFSPAERTMLKNILGLRERRVVDVMVPRADIIGVQRDIAPSDGSIRRRRGRNLCYIKRAGGQLRIIGGVSVIRYRPDRPITVDIRGRSHIQFVHSHFDAAFGGKDHT